LDRKDIQVVIYGTVDRRHTLVSLAHVGLAGTRWSRWHTLRSKKDIYCQKPLTLTIEEGQHLVSAVRDTGGTLQAGRQQRSDKNFRLACELVRDGRNGRIGKLQHISVWLPRGQRKGPFAKSSPPSGFDCIRTRKAPICEAEIGHRSASLCGPYRAANVRVNFPFDLNNIAA